jgi:hypothetical protein
MQSFVIFSAYISWGNGGKRRPVLVYAIENNVVKLYPITTQYHNKSDAIKARYFKINDLIQAGLEKQSYVDTGTRLKQPIETLISISPIGRLSDNDKKRLIEFISKS